MIGSAEKQKRTPPLCLLGLSRPSGSCNPFRFPGVLCRVSAFLDRAPLCGAISRMEPALSDEDRRGRAATNARAGLAAQHRAQLAARIAAQGRFTISLREWLPSSVIQVFPRMFYAQFFRSVTSLSSYKYKHHFLITISFYIRYASRMMMASGIRHFFLFHDQCK